MTLKEELLAEIETMTETQIAEFTMMLKNMKPKSTNFDENQIKKISLGESIAKFREELIEEKISCYAPKLDNPKMVKSCGVGILPARLIQIKCTTA